MLSVVRELAAAPILREVTSKFEVKGFDETLDRDVIVDVLSDRFVVSKRVIREDERSRAISKASAYQAIDESYRELRDDLIRAASLSV